MPHSLPDKWTIRLRPVLNLIALTLHDDDGRTREVSYQPRTDPAGTERTVHTLDEIPDERLRRAAQKVIDSYFERLTQARSNADAFTEAVPDWHDLTTRLRHAVPGCRITTSLDNDTLALRMTLIADAPAASGLLTLTTSWPGSATPGSVEWDLDETGTLMATFGQPQAQAFLTWYRSQPTPQTCTGSDREGRRPA